jgi:tryptophan-rich sensory protein
MGWALVEIIALWLAILVTIFSFANISKTAAWLLVPYIAWVSFATILNYTLWKIN